MRSRLFYSALVVWCGLLAGASKAPAQQVTVGTPFNSVSDSFFENIGIGWELNWNGGFMRFGGVNQAAPQFGGYDPNAGLSSGFAFGNDKFNGFFNWTAGQGSRRSFVSQTPSVTLTNGYPGYISDTSQSPFVISVIPVVGGLGFGPYGGFSPHGYHNGLPTWSPPGYAMGGPGMAAPVSPRNHRVQAMRAQMAAAQKALDDKQARGGVAINQPVLAAVPRPGADGGLNLVGPAAAPVDVRSDGTARKLVAAQQSSAGRSVPSVAEARRLHQLEQAGGNGEAEALYVRGLTAEEGGKPNVAKIYYRSAAKRATGTLREKIQTRLHALSSPGNR